jgi:carboxylate-amine ligase
MEMSVPMVPALGVEEEYLLLDPSGGAPMNVAGQVLQLARREPHDGVPDGVGPDDRGPGGGGPDGAGGELRLRRGLVEAQLELRAPICEDLAGIRAAVSRGRALLAGAAHEVGAVLAPVGVAPVDGTGIEPVTDVERHRRIHAAAPGLAEEQLVNGLHVHVEVPDRDTGITVMNRIRPWLHVLLALSANSPWWRGRDSGFASWRTVQGQRWGVEGPPPAFRNAGDYDRRVDTLVGAEVITDREELFWSARLCEEFPGVEVRVADVQLDVDSTVMLAALVRALVMVSMRSAAGGVPEPVVPGELLRGAAWHAARHGATGDLLDLVPGRSGRRPGSPPQLRSAADVVAHLLHHISPVARDAHLDDVLATLAATLLGAGGDQRQRRAMRRGGLPALLDLLAVHTGRPPAARPKADTRRRRLSATG